MTNDPTDNVFTGEPFTAIEPNMNFVIVADQGEELVRIDLKDGTMTFGPNYVPEQAARMFWDAIIDEYREYLKWRGIKK